MLHANPAPVLFLGMNSNTSLPRRSTDTPSLPARLNCGMTDRMERAESGPKIVYCGKPRRGMAMLNERDCVEVALLSTLLMGSGDFDLFFVAFDDTRVDAEARRIVEELRVEDAATREAKAPRFLDATEDDIMVQEVLALSG